MSKKGIKKMAKKPDWKPFEIVPHYSDYGDITHTQIIRRWLQHVNRYFDNLNESIIEFIERYTELSEMIDEHEAFMQAWAEMIEQNDNFIEEVRYLLEQSIEDPRVQKWITDRLDKMIKEELPHKLDKKEFYDFLDEFQAVINKNIEDVENIKNEMEANVENIKNEMEANVEKEIAENQKRLREIFINVKDFGAKGDGKTIDTKSIQQALDYAESIGGGVVFLPAGRYMTDDNLFIGDNTVLTGVGKGSVIDANKSKQTSLGTALIRTKYHDRQGAFSGASGFRIENLTITSSDRQFQGIYTDNARDFVIRNIWGERTLHHYLDINNSKNGVFENLFLKLDSNSCIQFDGRKAVGSETAGIGNENMSVKSVFVDGGKLQPEKTSYTRAVFHFHRANQMGIHISDVYTNNVDTLLYKDNDIECHGITIQNVKMNEFTKPFDIRYLKVDGLRHSRGWTVSNMYVRSETSVKRAVGRIEGVHDLTLSDYHASVEGKATHDPVVFDSAVSGWNVRNTRLRGIYHKHQLENIFQYLSSETDKAKLMPQVETQSTGRWTPTITGATGYARRVGWYVRQGSVVTVFARITLSGVASDRKGSIIISGLPFTPIEDQEFRGVGSTAHLANYTNTASGNDKMVGVQIAMDNNGNITLQRNGTNEPMSNSQMESNFICNFSLTYLVGGEI